MPFSHHSHSGQFCAHAVDTLAQVVEHAVVRRHMTTFALTEHCPRSDNDLYPEEASIHDGESLRRLFDAFVGEASRLRQHYLQMAREQQVPACEILVGFEAEWIRPLESAAVVRSLLEQHLGAIDFFIGSVHHVETVPIDFDQAHYDAAKQLCGGTEVGLFSAYFEAQLEMLRTLRPKIVGHFDLIRLFAKDADADLQTAAGGALWPLILRNLDEARAGGALLEINTSALRKGLAQPYPRLEVCRAWKAIGGDFVLSDDSHGIGQIGTNYAQLTPFLDELGLESIAYLAKDASGGAVEVKTMRMEAFRRHAFWSSCRAEEHAALVGFDCAGKPSE